MSQHPSPPISPEGADILRFPAQAPARPPVAQPDVADPESRRRLQTALQALDAALERQRLAVAQWHRVMAELHGQVTGLGKAMVGLQTGLGRLDGQMESLQSDAGRLGAAADGMIGQSKGV